MTAMQTPGILPGLAVTVPLLIIVVLMIAWLVMPGDTICNYCNDDGDPCPRCGGVDGYTEFTDDDGYTLTPPEEDEDR